jgi:soluble lytic murein transglycosylase
VRVVGGAALLVWAASLDAPPVEAAAPALSADDRALFRKAIVAMDGTKWKRALDLTRKAKDPLLHTIAKWRWLSARDGLATWQQARDFHSGHSNWPFAERRQALAERRMPADLPESDVRDWFERFPPVTGPGQVRYTEALAAVGADVDVATEIRAVWRTGSFQAAEVRSFLRRYGQHLGEEDHAARLDRLIWDRQWGAARAQLRRVPADVRRLGTARIRLGSRSDGVDAAVASVPSALLSDPGLVFERARWRRRSGMDERALELLFEPPAEFGPRPGRWWFEVRLHVRRLINAERFGDAYRLVSAYSTLDGVPGVEADWLAGWIALRFLGDSHAAYRHFREMRSAVTMPVSIARAAYWAGLSAEGDEETTRWLDEAALYPATFYGQMAARCRGRPIAVSPPPAAANAARLESLPEVRAMLLLAEHGRHDFARLFARQLGSSATSLEEVGSLYRLLHAAGHAHLGLAMLRKATRAGFYEPGLAFPDDVHASAFDAVDVGVERALLLAVARQESAFQADARSSANARGLMQVLPSTAEFVARRERIKYDREKLFTNAAYNVAIGSRYLAGLLEDYDQSYPLALAGYNAGPGRVKRWLRRYGDPRGGEIAMLDWLELIPVNETRNYVQRVLEGLVIYRLAVGNGVTGQWEMPLTCPR